MFKRYNANMIQIKNNTIEEQSLLIIGEGSKKEIGQIKKYDYIEEVETIHGRSQLTQAYKEAKSFNIKNIYILNLQTLSSYIDISETLGHSEFTYIVPLGIKYSDIFVNKLTGEKSNFINEYKNTTSETTDSVFIFTDEHASYYEDIDHFLVDQNRKIQRANELIIGDKNKENFICVLNHLQEHSFANLILACAMISTPIGEYPRIKKETKPLYYLNDFDVDRDLVYFRDNIHVNTSIENLVNLRTKRDVYKSADITRVINYIKRNLDLSEYSGMIYNSRVELMVHNDVKDFFTDISEKIIRGFEINNIKFKKIAPGVGILIVEATILPINFIDKVPITLEV